MVAGEVCTTGSGSAANANRPIAEAATAPPVMAAVLKNRLRVGMASSQGRLRAD
jgi:hypothetical protein